MTTKQVRTRISVIVGILGDILWRSFGLAWYVVPTGMGIGSIPALGTNWVTGGLIAFGASWVIAARDMGREIAMTSRLSMSDVSNAFKKAVAQQEKAEAAQAQEAAKK
jgi:hypothetical protein